MKLKNLTVLIFFLFFFFPHIHSQQKIVVGKDTVIAITPTELGKINGMIEDLEWTKKENRILHEMVKTDSIRLCAKDSIISAQLSREQKKELYYINQAQDLVNENTKLKSKNSSLKKKTIFGIGIGTVLGFVVGLLL